MLGRHAPVFGFDLDPKHVALPAHDEIRHALREICAPGDDADLERAHVATVERAEVLHDVPLNDALGLRLRSRLALTKGFHGVVIARMQKEIKIACKGAAEMELQTLVPMQGDLKDLSEENYEKLKKEIIELGFSEPISVWIDPEGQAKLLNGHQRTRVLHKMRDDGWAIPPLPVSIVEAESHQQAMKKILSLTSQYGEITKDGLYKFMNEAQLSMGDVAASFRFPEVDFPRFREEFFAEINIDGVATTQQANGPSALDKLEKYLGKEFLEITLAYNQAEYDEVIQNFSAYMAAEGLTTTSGAVKRLLEKWKNSQ